MGAVCVGRRASGGALLLPVDHSIDTGRRMDENEQYLFDINGYLHLKGVLSPEEVARCNAAIDHHHSQATNNKHLDAPADAALGGTTGRLDLGNFIGWGSPWREPFRELMVHPRIVGILNHILGKGFRLDHGMGLIMMQKGAEGLTLHGSSGPGWDPHQYYVVRNGKMHCGLTVVAWQFADVHPGDGGLALIPGSHKGNFACPAGIRSGEEHAEAVKQVTCLSGDCVIFTEATTHGTLPWTAEHERRQLIVRYTPGNTSYASVGGEAWPVEYTDGMTDAQLVLMEPPYHSSRVDIARPFLNDDGSFGGGKLGQHSRAKL